MTKAQRQARKEGGFTIAEVVVATFMVTLGLMSLAAVMSTVVKRQSLSQAMTTMTNLASTTLEEVKGQSYAEIETFEDGFGSIDNFPTYKRRAIVTPNDDDSLKLIEVKVSNATGNEISIQTVVTR